MNVARIAVLAVALVAGGVAAVLVSGRKSEPAPVVVVEKTESSEVLVFVNAVPMGVVVKPEDLAWRLWPKQSAGNFVSKTANADAVKKFSGSIARQPVAANEPVNPQKLVKPSEGGFMSAMLSSGMRAVATPVSAVDGAGGFILPNDRVDVVLTTRTSNGKTESQTILTNVRVLAIDQTLSEKDGQQTIEGKTATLELLPHQTEIVSNARQEGTISLALRSLADANPGGPGLPEDNSAGGGNSNRTSIIRFGIATN